MAEGGSSKQLVSELTSRYLFFSNLHGKFETAIMHLVIQVSIINSDYTRGCKILFCDDVLKLLKHPTSLGSLSLR